jgi:PQQ-dependent dehydrogenase (methanol/ethanol family)
MDRLLRLGLVGSFVLGSSAAAQSRPPKAAVWPATAAAGEWPLPARDYAGTRSSPLNQITVANVQSLKPVWSFSTGLLRAHEGNPLVLGSVMYVHSPFPNAVFALDLARPAGPMLWRYDLPAAAARLTPLTGCCDVGSRGIGYHPSGKLYVPLLTGDLVALDAKTGREIWRVKNTDAKQGGTLPAAPLVVGDLVLIGSAGAEYGIRGDLTAYDASTGRLVWRAYHTGPDADVLIDADANVQYASHRGRDLGVKTWPAEAWRHGGATASGWISYDPELNLVYYGTDHPAPYNATLRAGDNKWSNTLFARDPITGKVRWAYQITPHDEWGFDGSNESILADLKIQGSTVRALVHFDRNGFAYTLDRVTGQVLLAERYGPTNWATRVDQTAGIPIRETRYSTATAVTGICPAAAGMKGLGPAAYSPESSLFFVPVNNLCMDFEPAPVTFLPGKPFLGATIKMTAGPGGNRGRFIAWDATTGAIAWQTQEPYAVTSGVLVTAGGLVFYGTMDGWLKAADQKTGQELWKFKTPSGIVGNPITFTGPDSRQYIAVLSGLGGWLGVGGNGAFPEIATISNQGGVLFVFGL